MVANRLVLLDNLTRGWVMRGVGPGALVTDAHMLGIDPNVQRDRMDEALGIILRLFRESEPITYVSDWFELYDAVLQRRSLRRGSPCPKLSTGAGGRTRNAEVALAKAPRHGTRTLAHGGGRVGGWQDA